MATRLILLCCAATAAARTGAFAGPNDPLDEAGAAKAAGIAVPPHARALTAPSAAARETARLAGLSTTIEPRLADADAGAWAGATLADIRRRDPERLARWIADPAAAPPGGESHVQVADRLAPWLDGIAAGGGAVVAVTHPAVIRAAIALALAIPLAAARAIDIAPLSRTHLSFHRHWRLQGLHG